MRVVSRGPGSACLLPFWLCGTGTALFQTGGAGGGGVRQLAFGCGGRSRSIAPLAAAGRRLAGVIGDIPSGPLELHGRSGEDLLQFTAAVRTGGQRRIGKLLDPLG